MQFRTLKIIVFLIKNKILFKKLRTWDGLSFERCSFHGDLLLNIAKEIDDRMFTVSISNQLKTAVTNDLSKNYQGDIYERSACIFIWP